MPTSAQTALAIPYLLIPGQLKLDDVVTFIVAVLVAITVNAEAQAFAATFFGDVRAGSKDRLHFNAFLHIDILGSLCFLLGGFGWPRTVNVDDSKFRHPTFYSALTRLAGPAGNFLMANIAASIGWIFGLMNTDPRVFNMVMGVNLTMAAYNLIPLPPLAGGHILAAVVLPRDSSLKRYLQQIGPFLIVALVATDRLAGWNFLHSALSPLVQSLFQLIKI